MSEIVLAKTNHSKLLAQISSASFWSSHGKSASKHEIETFIAYNYNEQEYIKELKNPANIYYLLFYKNQVAGYSKINLNSSNANIDEQNISKLDRLYLLEEYYGKKLGEKLFIFNVELSKQNQQKGMWLAVWVENYRAVNFYKKRGFKIVGKYDFKISATHSNPNHIMFLKH